MQNLEVLRDMIPPAIRKTIYAAYLVAGIVIGVLAIVVDAASWLGTTQEVYAYLGIPVGAIALTNVVPNALVTATPAAHVDEDAVPPVA